MSIAHAILGTLLDGDRHGYQIAAALSERIAGGPYNSGQVHQALERLEERGWAVSHAEPFEGRSRRPYAITPSGREEFFAWLQRPMPPGRPVRDEVIVKLTFLARHDPETLVSLLELRRAEHLRRLARQDADDGGAEDLCSQLVQDAFRFREEADLRWVEHCIARLQSAGDSGRRPVPAAASQ